MLHKPASPHCIKPAAPNIAKCVGGSRHTMQFGSGSAFYGHTTGSQTLDGWYVEGLHFRGL